MLVPEQMLQKKSEHLKKNLRKRESHTKSPQQQQKTTLTILTTNNCNKANIFSKTEGNMNTKYL